MANWEPPRLSSVQDPVVRAILQSLKEYLNHPKFADGFDVSDGAGGAYEHHDSTTLP
jgi:hypothetical protein